MADQIPLGNGRSVDFFDSRRTPGGEMGAMDVIEQTRRPSILRTSEGEFLCWLNGHTASGRRSSIDEAIADMRDLVS